MESLDVKEFIVEIQQRPVIWDVGCSDYSNREMKKRAWEEIVNIFLDNEDATVHEKRDFEQQLHRRWKSLRDSYAREMRLQKQTNSGGGPRKRPIYVYFKSLSFLEKAVVTQPLPNSSTTDDDQRNPPITPIVISPLQRSTSPVPKTNKTDPVGEILVNAVEKSVQTRQERVQEAENDCDKLFLLSLVNPLKQIPEYARFGVKRKLMDLLDRELQFYGQAIATDAPHHHFRATNSSNTFTSVRSDTLSPMNHLNTSTFNGTEMQFTLGEQELNFKDETVSPSYSNSSAITNQLSDNEEFEAK
ncbi:uncharacterized protein [Diabrotica undecimpunctata]|uniref:uncharacterized protein n=1 Tax=Diabrotica undecimpunctata TaxID=50387 RepID=UPI003B63377E